METINDIVAEMRKRFEPYAKSNSNDARYVAYLGYAEFADRIKAAVKREREATCRESLQVGNAAKMREALKAVYECAKDGVLTIRESAFEKVLFALSAPPRNCDRFNAADEALSAYCEEKGITHPLPLWYGNEFWGLLQWLFAEAKGEN